MSHPTPGTDPEPTATSVSSHREQLRATGQTKK
jgi:hypothetical protein